MKGVGEERAQKKMINIRKWRHRYRQPRQQQCCADGTESAVHLSREEGERGSKRRSHRRVGCQGARCHGPIRDDDVREGGREDEVGARAEWDRREHGHDPGYALVRREGKPEEREWYEHAAHLPHQEAKLRRRFSAMLFFVLAVLPFVVRQCQLLLEWN